MNGGRDASAADGHGRGQALRSGLRQMGLDVGEAEQSRLLDYLALLQKWNRAFNLTAVRDPDEMVPRHLLDSLSILHLVQGNRILDVGSGPGLPGIPLAIVLPGRRFTLLDANGKKTRFMRQAVHHLGLSNVEVVQNRVEAFDPGEGFDTITSRAFAALEKMAGLCRRLLTAHGCLLAMQGELSTDGIATLQEAGWQVQFSRLEVPGSTGARHAVLACR